jgi:hypothetical protein
VTTQGAAANFSQPIPIVDPNDAKAFSLAEMGVFDRTDITNGLEDIEIGWQVDPTVYGDIEPHLFVFTFCINNAGQQEGCYVTRSNSCGFVPLSGARYYPGDKVQVTNTPLTYEVLHYQGYWSIGYINQWIGYFPDSHWNNTFTKVEMVQWWGEVAAQNDYPCTQMGNGSFGHADSSAVIQYMILIGGNGGPVTPASAQLVNPSRPDAWDAGHFSPGPGGFSSFTYGGPGYCAR